MEFKIEWFEVKFISKVDNNINNFSWILTCKVGVSM